MRKIITYLIYIAIPLATGIISGIITSSAMKDYALLEMPPFSPPGMLFPIVWTILFILMGTGAFIVFNKKDPSAFTTIGLIMYYVQLFMNFVWSIIFFNAKQYMGALLWIIIMWLVVLIMLTAYRNVSKLAFYLNIPLILWLSFALYLNAGVVVLQ